MARTTTASTQKVETEKKVEEKITVETEKEETVKPKKSVSFGDDDIVKVKCASLAGKSVIGKDSKTPYVFNDNGITEVKGNVAKYFLSIPGYELVK
jgi:hypothetical protein